MTVSAARVSLHPRPELARVRGGEKRLRAVAELSAPADRCAGRSAIVDVPEIVVDGTPLCAVKLKGVGWTTAYGRFAPPPAASYFDGGPARWLSVDYDEAGRILAEPAEDRPRGALLLRRARHEDAMLARVRAAGLPAPVPLGCGRFGGLLFDGRPTGFVIIGLADPLDRRVGEDVLAQEAAIPAGCAAAADLAAWYVGRVRRVAALQRRLHRAGFTGNGPHLGNFSADDEGETIHDLDALEMPAAGGLSETRLLGKILRDYCVLAASVGRRACAPPWRPQRAALMRAVGEGYFGAGAGASPEVNAQLDRLEPFDHLRSHPLLQRRGNIFELPAPLRELMRQAMRNDRPSPNTEEE